MVPVLERMLQFRQTLSSYRLDPHPYENYFSVQADDGEALCQQLNALGFTSCDYMNGLVQIEMDQPDFCFFLNQDDFSVRVEPDHSGKYLAILEPVNGHIYYFDYSLKKTIVDNNAENISFFFENVWEYFDFIELLKQQEFQENRPFYFVDHYDDSRNQFVFISPKKEGKLTIPFEDTKPLFDPNQSLKPRFDSFKAAFNEQNKHLPKFIKYELFNVLTKVDRKERMMTLVDKLPNILHTAEQNFEVYLHDLSLDKLKSEYQKSQEEYFSKLREVLGKLSTQIFAFPISITATAFATFKAPTTGQPSLTNALLWLIVGSFLGFTMFTAYLLKVQRIDVELLKVNFERDFEKLTKNKFFENPANEKDKALFDDFKSKVNDQFRRVNWAVLLYFAMQTLFNSLFIIAITFQITNQIWFALAVGIASIFMLGFVYFYVDRQVK